MRRLLFLVLWLPLVAFAQTTVGVSVTYTPGAAAAAGGDAAITSAINARFTAINAAYAASGINITLSPSVSAAPYKTAPSDSRPLNEQYEYAKNNAEVWNYRYISDAAITVHICECTGTGATMSGAAQPMGPRESAIAIPRSQLDPHLEIAISKYLGAGTGYANRVRSTENDPDLGGNPYCWHTRESGVSDTSALVPFPAYWGSFGTGSSIISATRAPTAALACAAFRKWMVDGGGAVATWNTSAVNGSGSCDVKNSSGVVISTTPLGFVAAPVSSPIPAIVNCAENVYGYSKNANMTSAPYLPLGDGSHDSVGSMNTRAAALPSFFPNRTNNKTIRDGKRAGIWEAVKGWLPNW